MKIPGKCAMMDDRGALRRERHGTRGVWTEGHHAGHPRGVTWVGGEERERGTAMETPAWGGGVRLLLARALSRAP